MSSGHCKGEAGVGLGPVQRQKSQKVGDQQPTGRLPSSTSTPGQQKEGELAVNKVFWTLRKERSLGRRGRICLKAAGQGRIVPELRQEEEEATEEAWVTLALAERAGRGPARR